MTQLELFSSSIDGLDFDVPCDRCRDNPGVHVVEVMPKHLCTADEYRGLMCDDCSKTKNTCQWCGGTVPCRYEVVG